MPGKDPKRSQNRRAETRPPQEANSRTATKTASHSSRPRPERSSPRPLGNPLTLPGLSPWLRSAERLSSYPGQQQETHFEQPRLSPPQPSVATRTRSGDPGPVGRQRLPAGQNTNYGYLNYVLAPVKPFARVGFPHGEPSRWRPSPGSRQGVIGYAAIEGPHTRKATRFSRTLLPAEVCPQDSRGSVSTGPPPPPPDVGAGPRHPSSLGIPHSTNDFKP